MQNVIRKPSDQQKASSNSVLEESEVTHGLSTVRWGAVG